MADALDVSGPANLGEKRVDGVLAANLPALRSEQRKPLAIVDRVIATTSPEDLYGDFPKPLATQLTIKPLDAKLRSSLRQLLNLPEKVLVRRKLSL